MYCRQKTTKEREPKLVAILEEDVNLYKSMPPALLDVFFSRQEMMTASSLHKTNKSALRCIQTEKNKSIVVYRKVREMQSKVIKIGKQKAR